MKAIQISQYGQVDQLKYIDINEPAPRENEVRVRLYAAGVNPAESYVTTGNYAFYKPDLPFTPGFDGAGVIDALGEGVKNLEVGDRVFVAALLAKTNTGSYAEKMVCDASVVHPLPDRISYAQGAALGVPSLTSYRALFQRAKVKPGETVFIHGASGGVGLTAVQMAAAMGAKVIGTASTPEGRELILKAGAAHAIGHLDSKDLSAILELTQGKGPDVILEMLANVNLNTDLEILAKYGRIVIIGNRGTLEFDPRRTMAKEADVLGMAIWNFKLQEYQEALHAVHGFLQAGLINPIVGTSLPLEKASQAQAEILTERSLGKMILTIN